LVVRLFSSVLVDTPPETLRAVHMHPTAIESTCLRRQDRRRRVYPSVALCVDAEGVAHANEQRMNGRFALTVGLAFAIVACTVPDKNMARIPGKPTNGSEATASREQKHSSPPSGAVPADAAVACESGYELKDGKCADIDECGFVATPCGTPLATCSNKPGGYEFACPRGYIGGGPLGIACTPRLVTSPGATCIFPESGGIMCWGAEKLGIASDGIQRNASAELSPLSSSRPVVSLAVGHDHACFLLEDASVACWGYYRTGRPVVPKGGFETAPVPILGLHDIIAVTARGDHSCAIQRGGALYCWGANDSLQLGVDTGGNPSDPLLVPVPPVVAVSAGSSHPCVLHTDGSARCWGANSYKQLGGGLEFPRTPHLPAVVRDLHGAVQLAAGGIANGAVLSDGRAVWWGTSEADNVTKYAVGKSTTVGASVIAKLTQVVDVEAFNGSVCVLLRDGAAYCQGTALLGDGTLRDSLKPVRVRAPSPAIAIAMSTNQRCLLEVEGGVSCWGSKANKLNDDAHGQWTTTPRRVPGVKVFEAASP